MRLLTIVILALITNTQMMFAAQLLSKSIVSRFVTFPSMQYHYLSTMPKARTFSRYQSIEQQKIAALLDHNIDEVITTMLNRRHPLDPRIQLPELRCAEFPWLPDLMVKYCASRIKGAKKLNNCIQKNKLSHVAVQEQWLYPVPRELALSSSCYIPKGLVIAKKVVGTHKKPIKLVHARDLCTVIKDTLYNDAKDDNFIHGLDGIVTFIDTEKRSFLSHEAHEGLLTLYNHNILESDAKLFIEHEISKIKK